MKRFLITLSLCLVSCVTASAQVKASTGFYYPVDQAVKDDGNWHACFESVRHPGTDIFATVGSPVYAIADGVVAYLSGPEQKSGWGIGNNGVAIIHESPIAFVAVDGHIQTNLKVGDHIKADQVIGTDGRYYERVWNAEKEDWKVVEMAPHLHFGVRPDPTTFPRKNWGRMETYDIECQRGEGQFTNGFVAPISWITSQTPSRVTQTPLPSPLPSAEPKVKPSFTFTHPANYSGPVWIRITPLPSNRNVSHKCTIQWSAWQRVSNLSPKGVGTLYFLHHKGSDGQSIPMTVTITPPCAVAAGQGDPPPGSVTIDLNENWVHAL